MKHAAHVLERMINQNVQSDVVMDMRVAISHTYLFPSAALGVRLTLHAPGPVFERGDATSACDNLYAIDPAVSHCGLQYWDDESDALRPKEGTLLPLYRFTFRKAKNKAVRLAMNVSNVGSGSATIPPPEAGRPVQHSQTVGNSHGTL